MSGPIRFTGKSVSLGPEQMRQQNEVCLLTFDTLNNETFNENDIPDEIYIPPVFDEELCTQIAERDGLHTCDMTTTVNAYIWQGWLTAFQGKKIHQVFPYYQPDRQFTRKTINGQSVLIAGREEHAIKKISGANIYSAAFLQKGFSKKEIINKVLGALSKNIVLNLGDGRHSRLAVGYSRKAKGNLINVSDPYRPSELEEHPIDKVLAFHESIAIFGIARKIDSLAYRPEIPF